MQHLSVQQVEGLMTDFVSYYKDFCAMGDAETVPMGKKRETDVVG